MNIFIIQNGILFLIINSGNIFNYLFQLTIARTLTPQDYGAFNALNSMSVLITILFSMLPLVIAKFTVLFSLQNIEKVRGLFWFGLKWFCAGIGLALIAGWAAIPLLKDFLRINQSLIIVLMVWQTVLSFLLLLPMGILQGLQKFNSYAFTSVIGTAGRFASGIIYLLLLNWAMTGAVLAGLTGVLLSLAFALYSLHDMIAGPNTAPDINVVIDMLRYSIPAFLMSIGVNFMGQIDIVLARYFCIPNDAGYYATAAILGRIPFFLPGIFLLVIFPQAAKAHSMGSRNHSTLWWNAGLTGAIAGGFAGIFATWPEQIISLLYGKGYVQAAPLFRIISIAMALLAIANVFFTYCLARNHYGFLWILGIGLAAMLGSISLFHQNSMQIAWSLFISSSLVCIGTIAWFCFNDKI
jgi:O-antigen/teichoic acid export membrane protein